MKRLLPITAAVLLAAASLVFAQATSQAVLRVPGAERAVSVLTQGGQTFFAADDVIAALGGTVRPEGSGFSAVLNNVVAAFGTDTRFAVVREDLIEMPATPVSLDGKPYVTLSFFQGYLARASDLEAAWDPSARVLQLRAPQRNAVGAQLSVANVQGITKLVVTLAAPVEYTIVRQPATYVVRFRGPVRPSTAPEQSYDDLNVTKTSFAGNELKIQLASPEVAGDPYKLENPFRIVIDLRKGTTAAATTAPASAPQRPVEQPGIRTIVIDPGHGGKDVGALGPGGTMEKDATLMVCRRLASALEAKTGARVILTRNDDTLIALDQRTAIANQYKADLFLSVHMNAAGTRGAHGSETYFLSADASDEVARKAAETENASARTVGETSATSDLKMILWDLAQQDYLQESSRFASHVQEEMNAIAGIQNRGVKQAPFRVLVGASMPAALVEVAFISNPDEEAKLKDDAFVGTVVDAVTRAVVKYKTEYETRIGVIRPPAAPAPAPATPAAPPATPAPRTGT